MPTTRPYNRKEVHMSATTTQFENFKKFLNKLGELLVPNIPQTESGILGGLVLPEMDLSKFPILEVSSPRLGSFSLVTTEREGIFRLIPTGSISTTKSEVDFIEFSLDGRMRLSGSCANFDREDALELLGQVPNI